MEETLKMMKSMILGYEQKMSVEELLEDYKKSRSPNILAYLFVTNYGLLIKFKQIYNMLDTDDIASYILQEMDKAIFLFDKNRHCKFITFFMACLKNRLRTETEQLLTHIKYANYVALSLDNVINVEDKNQNIDYFDLNEYCLTEKERKHCEYLMNGYSIKEIAGFENLTLSAIYQRNKQIGKKLLN